MAHGPGTLVSYLTASSMEVEALASEISLRHSFDRHDAT